MSETNQISTPRSNERLDVERWLGANSRRSEIEIPTAGKVLVLDDDRDAVDLMAATLEGRGHEVRAETRSRGVLEALATQAFDCVLTDLQLDPFDQMDGFALCAQIVESHPDLPVIVVTGHASLEAAVAALRAGAHDFVTKPVDVDVLLHTVDRAVQHRHLRAEVHRLRNELKSTVSHGSLLGDSSAMRRVFELISRTAATDATVLISGESGTGKELVARAIHDASTRKEGPFVAVNCAAVPASLLESELFGHVRGAFTDARSDRKGLLVEAHGGTLFLDEIGEMPLVMQVKLVRALQERTVRPVGGSEEVPFDARVIAATNRDLEYEIAQGRFREDLYYRIHVVGVPVPPLRERAGDIPLLATNFVARVAERFGKDVKGIAPRAMEKLLAYEWPGNVRELENGMERAVALTTYDHITVEDLPERVRSFRPQQVVVPDDVSQLLPVAELERRYMLHVLRLVAGNKSKAARILGYDRRTLYRKLARLDRNDTTPETPFELSIPQA
jgi:two-component system response regulator HydG